MASHIERRKFLATLLSGAAAAWPIAAHGQQPGKLPTLGFLVAGTQSSHSPWVAAFIQRLRELGWIEGRTVAIEYRWADGRSERFPELAAEFVRLKVDVIVTAGGAVLAAKQATPLSPLAFYGHGLVGRQAWPQPAGPGRQGHVPDDGGLCRVRAGDDCGTSPCQPCTGQG